MRIYHGIENIGPIRNAVVTTGSFDGVHIGHTTILKRLAHLAKSIQGESVLITFHPHPRMVLFPDTTGQDLKLITTQEEKINLLQQQGLDVLIIIEFTKKFSQISSINFIRHILVEKIKASIVVIGFNHHFGHNREGDISYLHELGRYYHFNVEEIPEQDIEHETVSSTRIRQAISEGKIQRATAYLNHYYVISGTLQEGSKTCATLGFNTYYMPITDPHKLIPHAGVYAVSCTEAEQKIKAVCHITTNHNNTPQLNILPQETHLNLTNKKTTIIFHKYLRNTSHFPSLNLLKKQLISDHDMINQLIY